MCAPPSPFGVEHIFFFFHDRNKRKSRSLYVCEWVAKEKIAQEGRTEILLLFFFFKGKGERNGVTKEAARETTEKCIEMFIGKEAGGGA